MKNTQIKGLHTTSNAPSDITIALYKDYMLKELSLCQKSQYMILPCLSGLMKVDAIVITLYGVAFVSKIKLICLAKSIGKTHSQLQNADQKLHTCIVS